MASSWIVTNLEIFAKTREAMTEAMFLDMYGSPLLQAAVGLKAEHSDTGRAIEHDLARAETRSKLEADMRRGGFLEAGLRALLYVLRGGGADERQFNALEALRKRAPESERLPLSQLKDIMRRQATLLRSNEKKAISTISKLLPDDPEASQEDAHGDLRCDLGGWRIGFRRSNEVRKYQALVRNAGAGRNQSQFAAPRRTGRDLNETCFQARSARKISKAD